MSNYKHLKSPAPPAPANEGQSSSLDVATIVQGVIEDVRSNGDSAVRKYSKQFDRWSPPSFKLSEEQIHKIIATVPEQTIKDIKTVQSNVRAFAEAQKASMKDFEIEIRPGIHLGQKNVPIQNVGCYVPGGRYPLLASAHMTILTAKVAGVPNVIACTPPIAGEIPTATIAAMYYAGADAIYLLGGTQAIAAMALGTETIPKVDFICGPGNAFVATAKAKLYGSIGIDLFAGPTEVLIVADEHASSFTVAVDLLSQAEHGPDTPAVLITTSERLAKEAIAHVEKILTETEMSTSALAGTSWRDYGEVIVVENIDEAYSLADTFASEHVQILTQNPREALDKMKNYGALFLGERTCVSYGDKVIGTNHVLPTKGAARYTGGLCVQKFLKTYTYQEVKSDQASGELGQLCGRAARAERFEGHARSGDRRAQLYLGNKYKWIYE
ncbi:histidinol dehydrogenase [Kwoniella dejecticola CBS 10117]|uniref:Histidinol dehydrogenase n=1 Tax=Kwoniella dejecticola CBS 10117 TaxID=1296121 RepID=A0A1A5ZTG4_9TREE|nr:histidinol dehydrogenase [Kwoniella dejecticola CBS 10117]OBR81055.1 histidinol dehydrogenase [Kwoniella dejecticola CBS 10117]